MYGCVRVFVVCLNFLALSRSRSLANTLTRAFRFLLPRFDFLIVAVVIVVIIIITY